MEIEKCLAFLAEAEKLKTVLRTAWASDGRRESTAEHSWRLALFAGVMAESYPGLDVPKLMMMSLIHDIGEIYDGDISAALRPDPTTKHLAEQRAAQSVFSLLPQAQARRLISLWMEYNENTTPEAKLVKALDKAETILQHNQGGNPPGFDYQFNLEYGKEYFEQDESLKQLRALLDKQTREKL